MPPSESASVNEIEGAVLQNLLATVDPSAQFATLLRDLATTRVRASNEFFYNRIFGSQIAALKALNLAGYLGTADLETFYASARERWPDVYAAFPYSAWLDFLLQGLVRENADRFEITNHGRAFLSYIIEQRLTEVKAF